MFDDILEALNESPFEEKPAPLEEFLYSKKYLGLRIKLSPIQTELVQISSVILNEKEMIELYGEKRGKQLSNLNYREIIYVLGKGSGKDYCSEIALAYVVHQLLCLKDPAVYYGKDTGDAIDIINVAINSDQANNVFFSGFKRIISKADWFNGRFAPKMKHFAFDKNINVYSGHSEAEAFEGYNTIFVVLDEISGFDEERSVRPGEKLKAQVLYDMYADSVTSRFPKHGKLLLLSFPRYKNDFIMKRYNKAVEEKEVVVKQHTFKIDPDLPDGIRGNEYVVEWEEDHIIKYAKPRTFCLKRPSWEVNPTMDIEDYKERFLEDPVLALQKYACMPPESESAFFTSRDKIETAFDGRNGVDELGNFRPGFKPNDEAMYFVHVDLARLHDRCAVALAHVESWTVRNKGTDVEEVAPIVRVDALRYWTPRSDKHVDFTEVREYILSLQRMGFNIHLVTFDRWESYDISKELRQYGLRTDKLSVAKKHYTDMAMVVHEERVHGPENHILIDELMELRVMPNDKIDHPTKGSKDLSDATCGAIFNSIAHTPVPYRNVTPITRDTLRVMMREEEEEDTGFPIRAPKKGNIETAPTELKDYLAMMASVGLDKR